MLIIVAGKLTIKSGLREAFIAKSIQAISHTRIDKNCEYFSLSPNPIEPDIVNIFEK